MKVVALDSDSGIWSSDIDDELSKIKKLNVRMKAILGILLDEVRCCSTTKSEFPFEFGDISGFFWYCLPEHQGSFAFFPVVIGDIKGDAQLFNKWCEIEEQDESNDYTSLKSRENKADEFINYIKQLHTN